MASASMARAAPHRPILTRASHPLWLCRSAPRARQAHLLAAEHAREAQQVIAVTQMQRLNLMNELRRALRYGAVRQAHEPRHQTAK